MRHILYLSQRFVNEQLTDTLAITDNSSKGRSEVKVRFSVNFIYPDFLPRIIDYLINSRFQILREIPIQIYFQAELFDLHHPVDIEELISEHGDADDGHSVVNRLSE